MKTEDIYLSDVQRILFGHMPESFLVEVIIRAAVIYLILIVSIRIMGKKMTSQLGRNELAAMVSLAAAIGIPIQDAERGLVPGLLIAVVIVSFQQLVAYRSATNEKFEKITQDALSVLVSDGRIDLENMKKSRISRERLFAQLRSEGVRQLGAVKRFYLEANGSFSLMENTTPDYGLSIIPSWDAELEQQMDSSEEKVACHSCGQVVEKQDEGQKCPTCGTSDWKAAVKEHDSQ